MHDLNSIFPASRSFGIERGLPLDRYYINRFISERAHKIKGKVLECGGIFTYAGPYGHPDSVDIIYPFREVAEADMTHIANLETGVGLSSLSPEYDCIILTQVLGVIFDVQSTVQNVRDILSPEGVLIGSVPCLTAISDHDEERWGEYWRFTPMSVRRLLERHFRRVDIQAFGNVKVACSYLHGCIVEDVFKEELALNDPMFPITICFEASGEV